MPEIKKHPTGAFSWAELATSDAAGAKSFYTKLFGWTYEDSTQGPDMVYTRLQKGGKDVGGLYAMRPDQKGMPPNWSAYFTVKSADESAKRASEAGGKILMGPFDVMEHGRMAVIHDPQGAFFSLWEPRKHIGVEISGEPGTPCWAELETTDTAGAEKFYTAVFPWTAKKGGDYTEWQLDGRGIGGMMQIPPEWGPVPPHWMVYFEVTDSDAVAAKVTELGGGVRVAPTDIPDVGRFAVLHDPQGASFAVVKLDPRFRK
jgi:predicted enzyme related to lactoylglutathione lyase